MSPARLASLAPLSLPSSGAHKVTVAEENQSSENEIRFMSKRLGTARRCAVEATLGPLTEAVASPAEFAKISLAKMQTCGFSKETTLKKPLKHKPNKLKACGEFEQPRTIKALYIEINPDRDQENVEVTNTSVHHPQSECKVEEPIWWRILKCPQTAARKVVLPRRIPNSAIVTYISPSLQEKTHSNLPNQNLDNTKGWDPDRNQRLKRKFYTWAAIQAADNNTGHANGGGGVEGNSGDGNNGTGDQQERPARISQEIPVHFTQVSAHYDQVPIRTYVTFFTPVPGDIVMSLECRAIQQNNPYFNPGGHCYLYTDEAWLDRERNMRQRPNMEGLLDAQTKFQFDDLIIRAGVMDYGYHWVPQRTVEVFRHLGEGHPAPWLLYARVPYQPLQEPITYANGDSELAHRTVHACIPGFAPRKGDLIMREAYGFTDMDISYYNHPRTQLEAGLILIRAGYARVDDSLLATVEMYQCLQNQYSRRLEWIFQGRDVQIYGGTQTLESVMQSTDPHAAAGPHPEIPPADITLAESYITEGSV